MASLGIAYKHLDSLQPLLVVIPQQEPIDAVTDKASVGGAVGEETNSPATGRINELHRGSRCIDGTLQQGSQQQITAALVGLSQVVGPAHRVENPHAGEITELAIDGDVTE